MIQNFYVNKHVKQENTKTVKIPNSAVKIPNYCRLDYNI